MSEHGVEDEQEARTLARLTDRPFKITRPAASRELTFWAAPCLDSRSTDAGTYDNPDQTLEDRVAAERGLVDEVIEAGVN